MRNFIYGAERAPSEEEMVVRPHDRKDYTSQGSLTDRFTRRQSQEYLKQFIDNPMEQCPLHDAAHVLHASLDLLQTDAVGENLAAYQTLFKHSPDSEERKNARRLILLVTSNVFNRADAVVELATKNPTHRGYMGDMLRRVLEGGKFTSHLTEYKGKPYANFYDVLEECKVFAHQFGVPHDTWRATVETIVQHQGIGMELVKTSQEHKRISYSSAQGLSYRRMTIGKYASLLAHIGTDIASDQMKFIYDMMITQQHDDMDDIAEDAWRQVNPFVALLHEEGVLDAYLKNRKDLHPRTLREQYFGQPHSSYERLIQYLPDRMQHAAKIEKIAQGYVDNFGELNTP